MMSRCLASFIVAASSASPDEASLLQTFRSRQHSSNKDHKKVICPFLKVLSRYNCIPDATNLTKTDYVHALGKMGDDGFLTQFTLGIFGSPLIGGKDYFDATKMDGSYLEASRHTSLGLADPSQKGKYKKLVAGDKPEHMSVKEFIGFVVKQNEKDVAEELLEADTDGIAPVDGAAAVASVFLRFGTCTDKATNLSSMTLNEFKQLFKKGKIPKVFLKNTDNNGCPLFDKDSWNTNPATSLDIGFALHLWPEDPSNCTITDFPNFEPSQPTGCAPKLP